MACATRALLSTLAMNLPLPSGSSPAEKPPESIRIWQPSMAAPISSMERRTSSPVRLRNTPNCTSAPALRKALAVS